VINLVLKAAPDTLENADGSSEHFLNFALTGISSFNYLKETLFCVDHWLKTAN